jgi:hypothetical protein
VATVARMRAAFFICRSFCFDRQPTDGWWLREIGCLDSA